MPFVTQILNLTKKKSLFIISRLRKIVTFLFYMDEIIILTNTKIKYKSRWKNGKDNQGGTRQKKAG